MRRDTLIQDINNIEDVMEQTVNQNGIIYWLAVAVWHLLQDKVREHEARRH